MANLASQYYVKAKENYPYAIEEAIESLNYALSYDNEHAGSHCLMARYYADFELNYEEAMYHFQQALKYNINYNDTYYFYLDLLLQIAEYEKAKTLITFAKNIKGICLSCILQKEALLNERLGELKIAKNLFQEAISISVDNGEISFIRNELTRVKDKLKVIKSKVKKQKIKESIEVKVVYKYR